MSNNDWLPIDLAPFHDTDKYGFVIPHPAYWGIRIPGFPPDRQPSQPNDPASAPSKLTVIQPVVDSGCWTGGDFSVLATRTPPLFHAFHHKTDESMAGHGGHPFERRAERNVVERPFQPRNPLAGMGRSACVELFDARFDPAGQPIPISPLPDIAFSDLDTRGLIQQALADKYFETQQMKWNTTLVGPLNALWLVILRAGTNNRPIGRLEGGYRLWHHLNHGGKTEGYGWSLWQTKDFQRVKFEIRMSGALNQGAKDCPSEEAIVRFALSWT